MTSKVVQYLTQAPQYRVRTVLGCYYIFSSCGIQHTKKEVDKMKGLGQFRRFDWQNFSSGKVYQVVGITDWLDRDTGKRLGKRVDVVITADDTQYEHRNGEQFTNLYERLTFKAEGNTEIAVSIGDIVVPVDAVARCYGDYNNQLSVTCKGIRVVPPQQAMPKAKM